MSNDEKVISLDERRRSGGRQRDPGSSPEGTRPQRAPRAPGAPAADRKPLPGRLIWLYCPTCHSIEYTELNVAGGRVHNVCGSVVQEAPVELDLRAEATIARINLERLGILESLLQGQRRRYEEYLHRLDLAAGHSVEPYQAAEGGPALPSEEVDALGLLVSPFFRDPAAHFPDIATVRDPEPDPVPDAGPSTGPDLRPEPAPDAAPEPVPGDPDP